MRIYEVERGDMQHIPVLLDSVLDVFAPFAEGNSRVFIDCTLGLGGHTQALLEAYPHIEAIGIDQDSAALKIARQNLAKFSSRIRLLHTNFAQGLAEALAILKCEGKQVCGILADIGVSSLQLDDKARGFGFLSDSLDMRMDTRLTHNASRIISEYSEFELERVFREYGEIRESKKMAHLIKTHKGGFASAKELSTFLAQHFSSRKIHPATLAFQALRIEVNDELNALKTLLTTIQNTTKKHQMAESNSALSGAIVAIISFHSLEDRIVKDTFKAWSKDCICPSESYRCECGGGYARGKILTKKPIMANAAEIHQNSRARSAKLRAFALQ